MRRPLPILLLLLAGCEGGPLDSGTLEPMTHTFPSLQVAPFSETTSNCQSWTLENDEPLFVNRVDMSAGPGWHHANWTYVPDTLFEGPDGTWDCDERDYEEFEAGAQGGVLFAQSTQSMTESQQFPPGKAIVVPERARIIAAAHLVNASDVELDTAITLTIHPLAEEAVDTRLRPFVTTFWPLSIPPMIESTSFGTCDVLVPNSDDPLDFAIHYVLPHYHQWGTGMFFRANGPNGVIDIYDEDHTTAEGDGWGKMLDPPIDLTGATSVEFGCRYDNTTDAPLTWANSADGEMCVMLAYANDNRKWVGGVLDGPLVTATDGTGRLTQTADCMLTRLP